MATAQCECNGGWALLLRASRVAGVAPVRVATRDGRITSVSRSYTIYSICFVTLINSAGIIGAFIHFYKNDYQINFWGTLFWVSNNMTITSIMTLFGTYRSARRVKNIIENINMLEEVKRSVSLASDIQMKFIKVRKKTLLPCLIISCSITLHSLIGYCILIIKNIYLPGRVFLFTHGTVFITKLFLELQIIYLALCISDTFRFLNHELERTLSVSGSARTKKITILIRTITQSYVSLCDVVLRMNKHDGFFMFLIVFDSITCLLLNGYTFFSTVSAPPGTTNWFQYLTLVICCVYIAKILLYIENCDRIYQEADDTRAVLSKLMCHLTPVGRRVSADLELMFKQVLLNGPHCSPCGTFSLQRSNVIPVLSVICTCAVYLVQLNAENS